MTGGITPKNLDWIVGNDSLFMKAYRDKGRVSGILDDVPLFAVLTEDLGVRGALKSAQMVSSYEYEVLYMYYIYIYIILYVYDDDNDCNDQTGWWYVYCHLGSLTLRCFCSSSSSSVSVMFYTNIYEFRNTISIWLKRQRVTVEPHPQQATIDGVKDDETFAIPVILRC